LQENKNGKNSAINAYLDGYYPKDIEAEKLKEAIDYIFQNNSDTDYERDEILNTKLENSDIVYVA